LQGFCQFRRAERGELAGKTWWSCGESVAENNSKSASQKHASFLHIFRFLFDSDWQAANRRRRGQFALGATCAASIVTSPGDFGDAYFHAGFLLNAG
jgi:hypothetical protein